MRHKIRLLSVERNLTNFYFRSVDTTEIINYTFMFSLLWGNFESISENCKYIIIFRKDYVYLR